MIQRNPAGVKTIQFGSPSLNIPQNKSWTTSVFRQRCCLWFLLVVSVTLATTTTTAQRTCIVPDRSSSTSPSSSDEENGERVDADDRGVALGVGSADTDAASYACLPRRPRRDERVSRASAAAGRTRPRVATVRDVDVGVPQRVDGSDAEKEAVRRVLRRMEDYFLTEVLGNPSYARRVGAGGSACRNTNELCAFWTSVGECESNRGFMLSNCAAACRLCLLLHTHFFASN